MKIFHASDLHYSANNLAETDRCLGFAIENAIEQKVDVAILTGDSTDHTLSGHSPALLRLAGRVRQIANHCPVFLLQGTFSHEPVGLLRMLAMIGAKHPIYVGEQIEQVGLLDGQWVPFTTAEPDIKYDLVITSVPTVNKADLAAVVGAENAGEAMGEHLAALFTSFAPINRRLRSNGVPTVLLSHGTVDGSLSETGVPMAGMDHEFTIGALLSAQTNAVLLGHIHKHQVWERQHAGFHQMVAYPGSIGRFHYGEIGDKHVLHWTVAADSVSLEAVVTPSRHMIDIEFSGAPDLHELSEAATQCACAFVRVRYTIDEESSSTVDRAAIKEILACAEEVKIEGTVLPIQRQRCAGISSLPSIEQQFSKWAAHSHTPMDGLIERLSALQTTDAVDIASAIRRSNRTTSARLVPRPVTAAARPDQVALFELLE